MLSFRERAAAGEPQGLLILHHGRGSDESDLLPLGEALDRQRRLHLVTPRAPLQLPGSPGFHWYRVPRVGYPDPATFDSSFEQLATFHDELFDRLGIPAQRTVLGGFSMGTVMSYALGLDGRRPVPAGILAFSGFVPTVEGWQPDLATRAGLPVSIAHGDADPVIDVSFARRARDLLSGAGLDVTYSESSTGHNIYPPDVPAAARWLTGVLELHT
jgi:phospholipase/carboxylesterase